MRGSRVAEKGVVEVEAVKKYLHRHAAKIFEVSIRAMSIRLGEWPMRINDKVEGARLEKLF